MTFLMLEDDSGAYELEDDSGGVLLETGATGPSVTVTTIQDGGPAQNEIQQITVVATGGTYALSMGEDTFGGLIPYDESAAALESIIGDWVQCSVALVGSTYTVEFYGYGGLYDWPEMTADGSNLT